MSKNVTPSFGPLRSNVERPITHVSAHVQVSTLIVSSMSVILSSFIL
jgi:hypothetical protein